MYDFSLTCKDEPQNVCFLTDKGNLNEEKKLMIANRKYGSREFLVLTKEKFLYKEQIKLFLFSIIVKC